MKAAVKVSWSLLRNGRRFDLIGPILGIAAVTVSTMILLLTLGVNTALQDRAERTSWRHPVQTELNEATALQAVATDFSNGDPIAVIDLAALKPAPPIPPGMATFPEPGQVWVSPALASRLQRMPTDQLSDRLLGTAPAPAGVLGQEALTYPQELVAVIGREADDPAMTDTRRPDPRRDGDIASATPIVRYGDQIVDFSPEALYVGLGRVAAVLVVVPLMVLGAAAARLSVSRRDERLAALRLIGASPSQVVTITVIEALLTAAVGGMLGAGLYLALTPVIARLPIGGGTFTAAQLWVGVLPLLAVIIAVPCLVGISAVVGLRQLIISPLGVARRHTPAQLKVVRLLAFGAVLVGYAKVVTGADAALSSVLVALAAAFLALALVGPWVLSLLGRIVGAKASTAAMLLAGRRLADDPRTAWRTVGGLALAAFVAGFLAPYSAADSSVEGQPNELIITAPSQNTEQVAQAAALALRREKLTATVSTRFDPILGAKPERLVVVAAIDDVNQIDRARTILNPLTPAQPAVTPTDIGWRDRQFAHDYRTVGLLILAASFTIAAASAAIVTAATVIDQRRTIQQQYLAGASLKMLYRTQTLQLFLPLAVAGGGALVVGLLCAGPYTWLSGAPINLNGLLVLLACVVVGTAAMFAATAIARPILRQTVRNSLRA